MIENKSSSSTLILVDYENIHLDLNLAVLKDNVRLTIFLSKNKPVIYSKIHKDLPGYVVETNASGPNALDYEILRYLGLELEKNPGNNYLILSKDKGFDGVVAYLAGEGFNVGRITDINEYLL